MRRVWGIEISIELWQGRRRKLDGLF
jgi:hypothetical protein